MTLICFASPSGGVGRTTLVANAARELARTGRRVIALDLDPQNALGMHYGLDLRDAFGFLSTLRYASDGRAAWRAALRSTAFGVSFLPHGQVGLEGANAIGQALGASPELLAAPVREMLGMPDVLVVADLPAGPSPAFAAIAPLIDLLVMPLRGDPLCMAQLPGVESGRFTGGTGAVGNSGIAPDRVAFILNQVDVRTRLGRAIADTAVLHLGTRLLGIVHRDETVPESIAAQKLVVEAAPEGRAAQDIAALSRTMASRLFGAPTAPSYAPVGWGHGVNE
jgi:cellulose synthase operon protein YhjQ